VYSSLINLPKERDAKDEEYCVCMYVMYMGSSSFDKRLTWDIRT